VKIIGNIHEAGLFVFEILFEFTLLTAIFNREFINYDYLGGVKEAFKFRKPPKDYKTTAERLLNWTSLSFDEVVRLAEIFVTNFAEFVAENGIKLEERTPLEKSDI
jgi:hypothetical protein